MLIVEKIVLLLFFVGISAMFYVKHQEQRTLKPVKVSYVLEMFAKDAVDTEKWVREELLGGIKNNAIKDNGTVSSEIEAHVVEVLKDERDGD